MSLGQKEATNMSDRMKKNKYRRQETGTETVTKKIDVDGSSTTDTEVSHMVETEVTTEETSNEVPVSEVPVSEVEVPVLEAPKNSENPEEAQIHFAPRVKKYAHAHEKTLENIKNHASYLGTQDWELRKAMITVGPYSKMKDSSVKGKIRAFVLLHGPISGEELVTRLFNEVDFEDKHKSDYVRGGKPTFKWIEDYVRGGFKRTAQYLSLFKPEVEPKTEPNTGE